MIDQLQEIRDHYTPDSEHQGKHATEDVRYLLILLDAETKRREAAEAVGREYALLFKGAEGNPNKAGYLYFPPRLRDALIHWQQVKAEAEKESACGRDYDWRLAQDSE